jgi:catechol 2,3-dioxygenase-like lactoylglutathione lyase family enzyme
MFKRIDHVEITSGDLDRSIRFYKEVFGFTLKERIKPSSPEIEEIVFLTLGDTMLELLAIKFCAASERPAGRFSDNGNRS